MYRERCRPKYSDEELKEVYSEPWHMESDWIDHQIRRKATLDACNSFLDNNDRVGADLSCGDAYFAQQLHRLDWKLGDFAQGYEFQGPIEDTLDQIPKVDFFILSETLEHLDEPDELLKKLRLKTKKLVLTTPWMRWWDENPQHYWAWDKYAVRRMLMDAGFNPVTYDCTQYAQRNGRTIGYMFQIWSCN